MKTVIFKLLDILKYNRLEIGDSIHFIKKRGDEYSEIRFDKSDGFCWISYDLIKFLSSITGFERSEVQELTIKWVEHTLQMKVKYNITIHKSQGLTVEHTLQMKVKYNNIVFRNRLNRLNIPYK
jgi:ATP-dependent exoDNAse (exonuclease V) alpha subunit